ncbi:vesicle transport protein Use1 [Arctopsyche grandis]|uniref:vesicle transport protein Use1 n=1 Tax=Arctopsyche grandis TaxID=121162 RepID=UPI00406D6FBE
MSEGQRLTPARRSRLEVDARRLLERCESLAKAATPGNPAPWRLPKYLEALQLMLVDLHHHPSKPSKDVLADYNRRYAFLQGLILTTKLKNPAQKVMAAQYLAHGTTTTSSDSATQEIHQKTTVKYGQELKSELFGSDSDDVLRHRNISKSPNLNGLNGTEDLDNVLQYHHNMQEKVAENMLMLTRNLKEQTQLASKIIKKDTEILKSSSQLTENNMTSLTSEHDKLKEHTSRACKCWLWIIISLVMMTFISMVLLMKVFKKRIV